MYKKMNKQEREPNSLHMYHQKQQGRQETFLLTAIKMK